MVSSGGLDFSGATVLFLETRANVRQLTRPALRELGFANIDDTSDFQYFESVLEAESHDLVIADITGEPDAVCDAVQRIRRGEIGNNPFVPVLLSAWRPSVEVVIKAINTGADDVVRKPVSVADFVERILALARSRRQFVIAAGYIGPERRKRAERRDPDALMAVPNLLADKAAGQFKQQAAHDAIKTATQKIKRHLFGRFAEKLSRLVRSDWGRGAPMSKGEVVAAVIETASGLKDHAMRHGADELARLAGEAAEKARAGARPESLESLVDDIARHAAAGAKNV